MTKRGISIWIVGLVALLSGPVVQGQIVEWEDCEKFLGNISQNSTPSNWLSYWNQVTPENAGKWGSVESTRDQMNWTNLDRAYNLAKDNGLIFKQHVFVWGNQFPSWITELSEAEQLEEIEEWIMMYCERYPDTDFIEVVNEPVNDPPFGNDNGNFAHALGGVGTTGWDWIIKAFELAKEYCPNAALMINEYNVLNNSNTRNRYIGIVDLLKERELIDAVGVQGHAFTVNTMTSEQIDAALDELAESGLPMYVTELDIDTDDLGSDNDAVQLQRYQEVFPAIWRHPSVKGVTLWGYIRNTMWRDGAWLVSGSTTTSSERPAMEWLKSYITENNAQCGDFEIPLGLDVPDRSFEIYPNPTAQGTLKIKSEMQIKDITVRNLSGQIMDRLYYVMPVKNTELQIRFKPGLYLVEVSTTDGIQQQRLIVK